METLSDTIAKRQSFSHLWKLLNPQGEYNNPQAYNTAMAYWNALTLAKQRQIYWQLRENKKHGIPFKPVPLYAIQDCHPVPTNWNGKPGINEMMKNEKMVSASYYGRYGIFTAFEAKLFEMEDIKPLN